MRRLSRARTSRDAEGGLDVRIARELIDKARADGVSLVVLTGQVGQSVMGARRPVAVWGLWWLGGF
jgi:hypothetical protein